MQPRIQADRHAQLEGATPEANCDPRRHNTRGTGKPLLDTADSPEAFFRGLLSRRDIDLELDPPSDDAKMEVADDPTALFVLGDPARGDAASFVRDIQIRLQLGNVKAWDDEQKIWFMIDKCESDLKDGLVQLELTMQGAPWDKVLGFATKDAFMHLCAYFVREFTMRDLSSDAELEAMLTDSFTQTSGLNKHLKLFPGICKTIDRSKAKDEQLSVREKVNLLINSLAKENHDGMGECDSLWQAAKIRHAETSFNDMGVLAAWLKEKERGLMKKS